MIGTKICTKCGKFFTTERKGNVCAECQKQKNKEYYLKNKEKLKQDAKIYYDNNRKQQLDQKKIYYKANKEKIDKYKRKYEKEHSVRLNAKKREWKENNLEKYRERIEKYYEKNKEKLAQKRKRYYEEHRDEILQQKKEYHKANQEMILEYKKEYYEINAEIIKHNKKTYRVKNREKTHYYGKKRYMAEKLLLATLTLEQWEQIKLQFENKCCYCGEKLPLQQDHFIPLTKGGEYTDKNIVPACQRCNSSKKAKLFNEWYPKQSFYTLEREAKILDHIEEKSRIYRLPSMSEE